MVYRVETGRVETGRWESLALELTAFSDLSIYNEDENSAAPVLNCSMRGGWKRPPLSHIRLPAAARRQPGAIHRIRGENVRRGGKGRSQVLRERALRCRRSHALPTSGSGSEVGSFEVDQFSDEGAVATTISKGSCRSSVTSSASETTDLRLSDKQNQFDKVINEDSQCKRYAKSETDKTAEDIYNIKTEPGAEISSSTKESHTLGTSDDEITGARSYNAEKPEAERMGKRNPLKSKLDDKVINPDMTHDLVSNKTSQSKSAKKRSGRQVVFYSTSSGYGKGVLKINKQSGFGQPTTDTAYGRPVGESHLGRPAGDSDFSDDDNEYREKRGEEDSSASYDHRPLRYCEATADFGRVQYKPAGDKFILNDEWLDPVQPQPEIHDKQQFPSLSPAVPTIPEYFHPVAKPDILTMSSVVDSLVYRDTTVQQNSSKSQLKSVPKHNEQSKDMAISQLMNKDGSDKELKKSNVGDRLEERLSVGGEIEEEDREEDYRKEDTGSVLVIENVSRDLEADVLLDVVSNYGQVLSQTLYTAPDGRSSKAEIRMKDHESCEWAVGCLNGEEGLLSADNMAIKCYIKHHESNSSDGQR